MADVARLGLVVDASGAQREIRLTREELVKLANGGTLAQKAVAGIQQPLTQTTTVAAGATRGLEKLRGPLTQIAITASGIPGPLGRVASVLSNFAMGGTVTVGVLAGVGAMSYAWEELTKVQREQQRENDRTVESFRKMERSLGESAKNIRIATLEAQEATLKGRVDQGIRGFGTGDTFWEKWSGVGATRAYEAAKQQLQDVRNRLAELRNELNKFTRDGGGVRVLPAINVSASSPDRYRSSYSDSALARLSLSVPDTNVTGGRFNSANMTELSDAMIKTVAKGLSSPDLSASIAKSAAQAQYLTKQGQAGAQLFGAGVGLGSQAAGPFGGAFGGIASGLMSGNGFLAAASGVTGLVDGLMSMAASAKAAREAARQWQLSFDSFMDSLRVEAGTLSRSEAGINDFRRRNEEQRRILQAQLSIGTSGGPMGKISEAERARIQAALDELNRLEGDLIEKRRREADELERLNSAYRNAPRGFTVEGYSVGPGTMTRAPRPRDSNGDTTVTFGNATFVLQLPAGSTAEQAQAFVQYLDHIAASRGSAGKSRAQAMELM